MSDKDDKKEAAAEEKKTAPAAVHATAPVKDDPEATVITDFAGTANGIFAVYGQNLNKGQCTLNGQHPMITARRSDVIKGRLYSVPGLDLKTGPVVVEVNGVKFNGTL